MNYSNFDPEELFALAKYDFSKNEYEPALSKLKVLIGRNQTLLDSYSLAGRIYATLELFEKAKECFSIFVKNAPEAIEERFQLGVVDYNLGNLEDALSMWDELLESYPGFPPALYHKALVMIDKDEVQQATDLLNSLLETAPEGDAHIAMADEMLSKLSLQ